MFSVGFEIVDEELKKALGDKGKGKGFKETEETDDNLDQKTDEKVEDKKEKVEISDDLD
jgi:hypothetical protein